MNNSQYRKGYKKGYNNPSQYNQVLLLKSNSDIAKGIIAGICDRQRDIQNNCTVFKK